MMEKDKKLLDVITEIIDNNFTEVIDDELKISICDYILDGNLLVKYKKVPKDFTYEKELKYDIENFNWDIKYPQIPSACQIYLQGFNHIKYLIQGYKLTLDEKYMNLASKLIKSWLKYESNSKNRFIWFKDIGPDRALVMIYFILLSKKNNISKYDELINEMDISLKKHADFFYEDKYYKETNHGTMIDRALYAISIYLDDTSSTKYRRKSIERLSNALKRNFSDKMVNLESSIAYHLFNMELFITIEKILLNPFEDSCGINQSLIESSIDFMIHCSKPDLNFTVIGDSHKQSISSIKNYAFYQYVKDYPPLKWFLTSNKSGNKPKDLFKVYKKEGFAFFRNSWDKNELNSTSCVSFISGSGNPSVITHKHADDLSFTLFAKGKDIFVDSGTYTYEESNMRKFFISALAHNTIVVDNKNYPIQLWNGSPDFSKPKQVEDQSNPIKWGNIKDTGILDYGEEEEYYYVVGKNDMYDGVNITRSLYYLKNGDVVIIDDIQSYNTHKYSQYFHLSPKITIKDIDVKLENNNTKMIISDNDININLIQIEPCSIKIIKGDITKAKPGIISEKFDDLKETNSLEFSLKSKNVRFLTLIIINDLNERDTKECYIKQSNQYESKEELVIKEFKSEIRIPLFDYSRKIFKDQKQVVLEQNDTNLFTFTIPDADNNETFAWYILKDGKKVDTIMYSPNPVLKYLFNEPGNYVIKYFVKNGDDKKMYTLPQIIRITADDIYQSKIKNGPLKK